MSIPVEELCDRFEQLYTPSITDSMMDMGYTDQIFPHEIDALQNGMRTAGVAFPVRGTPDESHTFEENIRRSSRMLGEAPDNSVVVIAANSEKTAHLGELSTLALKQRGCRGAVIDGGIRDVSYILEQDFPVFAKYRTPKDAPPWWRVDDWDVPVTIGSVPVRPGDIVVGDDDGAACVPRDIAEEVLERAEEMVATESEVREFVEGGASPLEAYDKYGEY